MLTALTAQTPMHSSCTILGEEGNSSLAMLTSRLGVIGKLYENFEEVDAICMSCWFVFNLLPSLSRSLSL